MKKYGKYEKMPDGTRAKQPPVKSMLLQTYFTSLLCLVLCVTMFFGTSYAWFTSEVNNEGNEIYIGTLDVELQKQVPDGTDADEDPDYVSLSEKDSEGNNITKLFDSGIRWEPGYTALETVKVTNKGDLAFRYELTFKVGEDTALDATQLNAVAKWFDVWCYYDDSNGVPTPANYDEITTGANWTKVGRLDEVLAGRAVFRGSMTKDEVKDKKPTEHTYTIALHMNGTTEITKDEQEFLMGKRIGLNVKLVATQLSSEADGFNANYDLEAFAKTLAQVDKLSQQTVRCNPWGGGNEEEIQLDVAYQFQPEESYEEAENSPYLNYVADFVVYADKDVPEESMALAGYYAAYCDDFNDGKWVVLTSPEEIEAGREVRLVDSMGVDFKVTYGLLCWFGNDGIGFQCGAADVSEDKCNADTTITVELRLFEVNENGEETGRYVTVGSYTHTFE